ncbi:hypothetical protein A3B02_00265 [Candidatus Roizmanbacteria bacterium RIFCSPLOWO2_01_FULL_42_14]|uniref:Pilus assembly protein, PilO n=4 Tax=Candidatus Roizmaniibacteriota TaxID=1752723 RepID=A0A1F7K1A5_9BACT|nr:MAG: hypothetical protein A3D08_01090 [Candidatus Roizmanbacteria bacterium RIFCSPHIGHO2_02_FULL_43_11]OGK38239.1 MAG: hypothetical protein A3F32_00540 [Candidatus Roizmanbacteria bacterium RIFCSPHIGHO2_12_FULL_42_10]OGK51440.1 MAG: hypothetical protein A3B02_00265 [Candidatus Roizmanbacteria bacterium RIFCSPLOWO2_01_FULL_42_14]OGK61647.1 MAG: hypothetical protein A3I56_05010 [Candidatus Roizmanbacteria bacterium RIFCSPLOWO2_02_FULL_43_10]
MKDELIKKIQNKSVKDYTYAIMFLLVASFFAFWVIRPVLSIAISIRRQGEDLHRINATYEKNITRVLELQSQIEDIRAKRYLLDETVPEGVNLSGFIQDIQRAGHDSGVKVTSVMIDPISLKVDPSMKSKVRKVVAKKDTDNQALSKVQTVGARIKVEATYEGFQAFLLALLNQRRIKQITGLKMTVENKTSRTEPKVIDLTIQAIIETYYLTAQKL